MEAEMIAQYSIHRLHEAVMDAIRGMPALKA